ncbi:hypothetical protein ASF72_01925 [Arthrobacter sp. Leaf141]|uniref:WxL protein peptidoglycan domain-containing protein n=1 Tax=Arthrobacter sp. Leaf141 TaxID=1736273 RepID=UPI0006FF1571|nr:DUF916 domain-containing protein [Arthrobacter sp. Leaf141]KQQ93613.1 hypothetical protein ASF72_01925 [Arthrobacter sp. Leaf141]
MYRTAAVVLISLLALLAGALPAQALAATSTTADGLSWSIRPGSTDAAQRSNFSYTLDPGATIQDTLVVTNLGSTPLDLAVYAADGVTSASGHLDLEPAATAAAGVGSWFAAEAATITVQPGAAREVPFSLAVPADASPGDHVGGVVTSFVSAAAQGTVKLDRRLATRLNVRVAGEETIAMAISDVTVNYPAAWNPFAPVAPEVTYTVTNNGNVRALADENVDASGLLGAGAASGAVAELIPGGSSTRTVTLPGTWPIFAGNATVVLQPWSVAGSPGTEVTAAASTAAVPWGQLAVLLVVVVLAVILARRRARQARA